MLECAALTVLASSRPHFLPSGDYQRSLRDELALLGRVGAAAKPGDDGASSLWEENHACAAARTHRGNLHLNADNYVLEWCALPSESLGRVAGVEPERSAEPRSIIAAICAGLARDEACGVASGLVASEVYWHFAGKPDWSSVELKLVGALQAAHARVAETQQRVRRLEGWQFRTLFGERMDLWGIGAHATVAAVRHDEAVIAHLGGGSAHLYRDGHLRQLTADHTLSLVAGLPVTVRRGNSLVHETVMQLLPRTIGAPSPIQIDLTRARVRPGDRIVLAGPAVRRSMYDDLDRTLRVLAQCNVEEACMLIGHVAEIASPDEPATLAVVEVPTEHA